MNNWKNTMLISPNEIKSESLVNYNVEDNTIAATIRVSQNVYLKDVIGKNLLYKLQKLVYNAITGEEGGIDDEENIAYKTLLDDYIHPVLQYKVASELCSELTLKLRNMGLIKNSDVNTAPATSDEVEYMTSKYLTLYNDALDDMAEFICENKEALPESDFRCPCDGAPRYANTGMWLGPNKRKRR